MSDGLVLLPTSFSRATSTFQRLLLTALLFFRFRCLIEGFGPSFARPHLTWFAVSYTITVRPDFPLTAVFPIPIIAH